MDKEGEGEGELRRDFPSGDFSLCVRTRIVRICSSLHVLRDNLLDVFLLRKWFPIFKAREWIWPAEFAEIHVHAC